MFVPPYRYVAPTYLFCLQLLRKLPGLAKIPILELTSRQSPLLYPSSFQPLTRCPFCNFFILMVFRLMGGCTPGCTPSSTLDVQTCKRSNLFPSRPSLFTLLRILLRSRKTQPVFFQAIAHSLPKTRGRGATPSHSGTHHSPVPPALCGVPLSCATLKRWEFCGGFHAGWENRTT